ncbi:MAG: methylenetetrahydrofolate reductase [NAD(P)H] [Gammaproteobacteria bacterium]|nr:methylenetetrahydrofolate reductase [NAD(P)H] [Gammaproteobacteria bacterium]
MSPKPQISFEYFPPKTEAGREKLLRETTPALNELGPEFFSCTYGAGGSTRANTFGIVSSIQEEGIAVAPHLSFGGDDAETIGELVDRYVALGINRLVALRGDMPSGIGGAAQLVYANELVAFVRERSGDHFTIAVAAYPEIHPQAGSYESDVRFLKAKFDAGADMAITQYFYNIEAYFYFLDQCAAAGIDKPIFAGVMPITNYENLARFSKNCGAELPRWICQRLEGYAGDRDSIRKFGVEVVTQLCQTLLDNGCPGIHFYTMNQVEPTRSIYQNLGIA